MKNTTPRVGNPNELLTPKDTHRRRSPWWAMDLLSFHRAVTWSSQQPAAISCRDGKYSKAASSVFNDNLQCYLQTTRFLPKPDHGILIFWQYLNYSRGSCS